MYNDVTTNVNLEPTFYLELLKSLDYFGENAFYIQMCATACPLVLNLSPEVNLLQQV